MTMTKKENQMAMYSHGIIDHMPAPMEGETCLFPVLGYNENPCVRSGKDWFGCEWQYEEKAHATAPAVTKHHVLEDISDWREVVTFPDLDTWDWQRAIQVDHVADVDRENTMYNAVILIGMFERLHCLMGFENALISLMEDPDEVADFFDAMVDFKIKLIDKIAEYYRPDMITFHDDWGTQKGPFFSPALWRELIKPRMKKIIDHTHNKGIIFLMHSCGKYDQLIPDIVDLGVDTLQCMDIMDIGRILEIAAGRMTVQASVHTQDFEARNGAGILTPEIVRETVSKEFHEWGRSGYYFPCIFAPSNWYEEIVLDEYLKVSGEYAGTYRKQDRENAFRR